jgi:ubiquinone/menaquinone biosynthesis C-methylase UbiE
VGIKQDAPTEILDVSCGPGDYSVAWTSDVASFLPKGMRFYCIDYPGGMSRETGEKYTTATAGKIRAAAQNGQLLLARPPVAIDADLFPARIG